MTRLFLKNCGRGENFRTTTCLKTVVGGMQGHAPCKAHLLHIAFFMSVKLHVDHKSVTKMRQNLATLIVGDVTAFERVVSFCREPETGPVTLVSSVRYVSQFWFVCCADEISFRVAAYLQRKSVDLPPSICVFG